MSKLDVEVAQKVVDYLNELVEMDKVAIAALIANRVPCNETLANHPTVQVMAQHGGYLVGLVGLLNGLCGIREDGHGIIAAEFNDNGPDRWNDLKGFILLDPDGSFSELIHGTGTVFVTEDTK